MKYIILLTSLLVLVRLFSFMRFNWKQKNKFGAAGVGILLAGLVFFTAYYLFAL